MQQHKIGSKNEKFRISVLINNIKKFKYIPTQGRPCLFCCKCGLHPFSVELTHLDFKLHKIKVFTAKSEVYRKTLSHKFCCKSLIQFQLRAVSSYRYVLVMGRMWFEPNTNFGRTIGKNEKFVRSSVERRRAFLRLTCQQVLVYILTRTSIIGRCLPPAHRAHPRGFEPAGQFKIRHQRIAC